MASGQGEAWATGGGMFEFVGGFGLFVVAIVLGIPLLIVFGRYPGTITQRASVLIHAPAEAVWDKLVTREDFDHWYPQIVRIERLPGNGERYACHMRTLTDCPTCSLPYPPDYGDHIAEMTVLEREVGRHEVTRVVPPDHGPWLLRGLIRELVSARTMTPTAAGVRVDGLTSIVRPKLFLAATLPFANAVRHSLEAMKAEIEDTEPPAAIKQMRAQIAEARASRNFCGCKK